MNGYDIFIKHNAENNKIEDVLLVKIGFNWAACLFSLFWFLFNRLWLFAIIFFGFCSLANIIFSAFAGKIIFALTCFLLGWEAENLLIYRFKRENY
ncbi:MAG: DUF2628 domain-containing protein, partial [Rickettsiales bacterium]|nr:DUF2628 domain-containing protein [Rickettsiales bacterium]